MSLHANKMNLLVQKPFGYGSSSLLQIKKDLIVLLLKMNVHDYLSHCGSKKIVHNNTLDL